MDGNSQYDHKEWAEIGDLPEAEKKLVQKQYEHQMKQTAETDSRNNVVQFLVS